MAPSVSMSTPVSKGGGAAQSGVVWCGASVVWCVEGIATSRQRLDCLAHGKMQNRWGLNLIPKANCKPCAPMLGPMPLLGSACCGQPRTRATLPIGATKLLIGPTLALMRSARALAWVGSFNTVPHCKGQWAVAAHYNCRATKGGRQRVRHTMPRPHRRPTGP